MANSRIDMAIVSFVETMVRHNYNKLLLRFHVRSLQLLLRFERQFCLRYIHPHLCTFSSLSYVYQYTEDTEMIPPSDLP